MISTDMKDLIIRHVLKVVPFVNEIMLYGSRVGDNWEEDSDYDVRAVVPSHLLANVMRDVQVDLFCNVLEEYGWNETAAPKIDLFVSDRVADERNTVLWRKGKTENVIVKYCKVNTYVSCPNQPIYQYPRNKNLSLCKECEYNQGFTYEIGVCCSYKTKYMENMVVREK